MNKKIVISLTFFFLLSFLTQILRAESVNTEMTTFLQELELTNFLKDGQKIHLDNALELCRRLNQTAPDFTFNNYLMAYCYLLLNDEEMERETIEKYFSNSVTKYEFLFKKGPDSVISYLAPHLFEFCYLRICDIRADLNDYFLYQGEFPGTLQEMGKSYFCPISKEPYAYLKSGSGKNQYYKLFCRYCDKEANKIEKPYFYPVFQQIAWKEHSKNRISNWKGADRIITPFEFFDALGIKEGRVIADIGCGEGYFTLPLAKKVGKKGKVFAVEIEQSFLDFIKYISKSEPIENITTVHSVPTDISLPEDMLDIAFLCGVYKAISNNAQAEDSKHYRKNVEPFLLSTYRSLKIDGKFIIVERDAPLWDRKQISTKNIIRHLEKTKFKLDKKIEDYTPGNVILIFSKKN